MKIFQWLKKNKLMLIACSATAVISVLATLAIIFFKSNTSAWYVKLLVKQFYVDSVTDEAIEEGAIAGIIQSLGDEHSVYIPSSYGYDIYDSNVSGNFEGIGITLGYINGNSQVIEVFENSPAFKSGILKGDIIVASGDIDLKGKTTNEVADVLRGEVGTTLNLTLLRGEELFEIENILREHINVPSVKHKIIDDNIGYIAVSNFDNDTDIELCEKLELLKETNSLIIDLRDNPGGRFNIVLNSLDLFLDEGILLTARYKNDKETVYESTDGVEYSKPVVVLVNSNSASASEIFAAALKERDRAVIVGVNTYGKGSIQRSFIMPDNAGINLTIGRFYSPDGNKIDKVGVQPDIDVDLPDEFQFTDISEIPFSQDTQLKKALEILQ